MMDDAWSESVPWTWLHTDQLCSSTAMWLRNVINWSQTDCGLCDFLGGVRKNKTLYLEGKHKVSRVMKVAKVRCGSGTVKMVMEWQKGNHGISLSRREQEEKSVQRNAWYISFPLHPKSANKIEKEPILKRLTHRISQSDGLYCE